MYHIVGDDEVSVPQFEWQVRFLRKYLEPVGLGTLVERLKRGTTTGREVAVTFDDGVRNHFTVAWPLLRAFQMPATFFVCPGLVESGEWLWRTELRLRLKHLSDVDRVRAAREANCPADTVEPMMEWTKRLPIDDRLRFQRSIERLMPDFSPSAAQVEHHAPLTWQQLQQMDQRLITIGSHTSTHPMLPTLSGSLLEQEIAGSRRILEQRLDRPVDLFSYPNGANNVTVVDSVRKHYRAAVTTRQDMVAAGDDLFVLPRIPGGGSRAAFLRRMHRPTA
jgi:peptidoglycan/xylan/chitin deacetylase (PgdA/CDA1 family)